MFRIWMDWIGWRIQAWQARASFHIFWLQFILVHIPSLSLTHTHTHSLSRKTCTNTHLKCTRAHTFSLSTLTTRSFHIRALLYSPDFSLSLTHTHTHTHTQFTHILACLKRFRVKPVLWKSSLKALFSTFSQSYLWKFLKEIKILEFELSVDESFFQQKLFFLLILFGSTSQVLKSFLVFAFLKIILKVIWCIYCHFVIDFFFKSDASSVKRYGGD
jgi:hypothetical protein